jgi:Concanavalin A-like lectin/glucanases superfamily
MVSMPLLIGLNPLTGGGDALLTNLVSYWKLDEASGTRADVHGTNHLTDVNTVTGNPGKIGTAAQFTAANSEYLSVASNASLQTGNIDFTVACWAYLDAYNPSGSTLINRWGSTVGEFALLVNPAGYADWYVTPDGVGYGRVVSAAGSIPLGSWHFVVAWHDSVNDLMAVQVDNATPVTTAYASGGAATAVPLEIGGGVVPAIAPYTSGRIDEVGYWKRILTPAERTALWNGGAGLAYPFTTAPWTPAALSPTLWLRADAGTYQDAARTIPAVADGDPVGGWADQSGNAHHASQATAAARPTLQLSELHGKPVLRFDGVDDYLSSALAHSGTALTHVMVMVPRATAGNAGVLSHGLAGVADFNDVRTGVPFHWANPTLLLISRVSAVASGSTPADATPGIIASVFDGTNATLRLNGVNGTPGASTGSFGFTHLYLASRTSALTASDFARMDVAELLTCTRALSEAELDQLDAYFTETYLAAAGPQTGRLLLLGVGG